MIIYIIFKHRLNPAQSGSCKVPPRPVWLLTLILLYLQWTHQLCLWNFSTAFDIVLHNLLFHKLTNTGLSSGSVY